MKRHLFVLFIGLFTLLVGFTASGVSAQEATAEPPISTAPDAPISTQPELVTDLPSSIRLTGLRPTYQLLNRCSAAALTIQLSYFGWQGTYTDSINALNTNEEDVAVRLDEMARFAAQQGLSSVIRYGGTIDMLKALVANGFPVLVENVYYDGVTGNAFQDFTGHNRVIMGYDDALGVLYAFDSLLGNGEDGQGRPMPYDDYDSRWKPFNRDFMVLYRPEEEARLQAVLGEHWDFTYNLEHSLALSQQEIDEDRADSYTLFNMGSSLTMLGRYEEAAAAFTEAEGVGLPFRMLWYQYEMFEAYYRVGRYEDVLRLARSVIANTPGVEETYYYAALAYEAQGDYQRAESNLEVALFRNINFTQATEALIRVRAAMGG